MTTSINTGFTLVEVLVVLVVVGIALAVVSVNLGRDERRAAVISIIGVTAIIRRRCMSITGNDNQIFDTFGFDQIGDLLSFMGISSPMVFTGLLFSDPGNSGNPENHGR